MLNETGYYLDFHGNPIYGQRDIGAIEYQPPYVMGGDNLEEQSKIRVYGDGRFRYLNKSQSQSVGFISVKPALNYMEYDNVEIRPSVLEIEIRNLTSIYTHLIEFNLTSMGGSLNHTICDLDAGRNYSVFEDTEFLRDIRVNSSGCLNFSTAHDTSMIEIEVIPGDSPLACVHDADNPPCDRRIDYQEAQSYLHIWIEGKTTLNDMLDVINLWKEQ